MDNRKRLQLLLNSGDELTRRAAEKVKDAAIEVYLSQRRDPTHNDYVTSFHVSKGHHSYFVSNSDSTWFWVEFGAHAGGKTPVLGYAPLRRGIDIVSSRS